MRQKLFNLPGTVAQGEFGIVANVEETDRQMRTGAKCWLAGGTGGEGWNRFQWLGLTRGHDTIVKWMPTHRMANFRAAWVPNHLRGAVYYVRGTREEMEKMAADLNDFAMAQRAEHPNRRSMKSHHEIKAIPPHTSI